MPTVLAALNYLIAKKNKKNLANWVRQKGVRKNKCATYTTYSFTACKHFKGRFSLLQKNKQTGIFNSKTPVLH